MIKQIQLACGQHETPFDPKTGEATMCVQEYVAWLAGDDHTDRPDCVCPILGDISRVINDNFSNEYRQRLRPLSVRMIGTRGDGQAERRADIVTEWLHDRGDARTNHPIIRARSLITTACLSGGLIPEDELLALLESLIDPGGIHDVDRTELEYLKTSGREALDEYALTHA